MPVRKRPQECSELYSCDEIVDAGDSRVIGVNKMSLALAELCLNCPRVIEERSTSAIVIVNDRFPLPLKKDGK